MTLDAAIDAALGKYTYVRREALRGLVWPIATTVHQGAAHQRVLMPLGDVDIVFQHPTQADYDADDWIACDVGGGAQQEDWSCLPRQAALHPGGPCTVRIADPVIGTHPPFLGNWQFEWMIPGAVLLSAGEGFPEHWLERDHLDVLIEICGAGEPLPLQLIGADVEHAQDGGRRVYRLRVELPT